MTRSPYAEIKQEFQTIVSAALSLNKILQAKYTERLLFLTIVLINLGPVLLAKFFLTLDGPSHLYNAQLLNILWADDTPSAIHHFYAINPVPVPNWSGHFLLALAKWFFPGHIAEKILLITYLVLFPYTYRYFIKSAGGEPAYSYLIFPFTYSSFITLGFYNFSLGLVFFFLAIGITLKQNGRQHLPLSAYLFSFFTYALLYFSHLFLFGLSVMFNVVIIGLGVFQQWRSGGLKKWTVILSSFRILLPVLPFLILAFLFFLRFDEGEGYIFQTTRRLIEGLLMTSSIISYAAEAEKGYTQLLFLTLMVITIFHIYGKIRKRGRDPKKQLTIVGLFWLFTLLLLALYFVMPDSNYWSGFFSLRMQLLFFLFWIVCIAISRISHWLNVPVMIISVFVSTSLINIYEEPVISNSRTVKDISSMANYIREGSVVFPIRFPEASNWLHSHVFSYLGIDKKMVLLNNYEADRGYFPVTWAPGHPGVTGYDLKISDICSLEFFRYKEKDIEADYIYVEDLPIPIDTCSNVVFEALKQIGYRKVAQINHHFLFERVP